MTLKYDLSMTLTDSKTISKCLHQKFRKIHLVKKFELLNVQRCKVFASFSKVYFVTELTLFKKICLIRQI